MGAPEMPGPLRRSTTQVNWGCRGVGGGVRPRAELQEAASMGVAAWLSAALNARWASLSLPPPPRSRCGIAGHGLGHPYRCECSGEWADFAMAALALPPPPPAGRRLPRMRPRRQPVSTRLLPDLGALLLSCHDEGAHSPLLAAAGGGGRAQCRCRRRVRQRALPGAWRPPGRRLHLVGGLGRGPRGRSCVPAARSLVQGPPPPLCRLPTPPGRWLERWLESQSALRRCPAGAPTRSCSAWRRRSSALQSKSPAWPTSTSTSACRYALLHASVCTTAGRPAHRAPYRAAGQPGGLLRSSLAATAHPCANGALHCGRVGGWSIQPRSNAAS